MHHVLGWYNSWMNPVRHILKYYLVSHYSAYGIGYQYVNQLFCSFTAHVVTYTFTLVTVD